MSDKPKVIKAARQYDPTAVKTRIGFYRTLRRKWLMRDMRCLPAIVVEYDDEFGLATVQPLSKKVYKDEAGKEVSVNRDTYTVHVLQFCAGGMKVRAPLIAGDTGYIFAGDRKCGEAIGKNLDPVVEEMPKEKIEEHLAPSDDGTICDFENGFFLPCTWTPNTIKNAGNFFIQNLRDKLGQFCDENKFGVVRDALGNDVPFHEKEDGSTESEDGQLKGQYAWSMVEVQKDGSINLYGQGKKFSVRKDGLYLDDKPLELTGVAGVLNIKGQDIPSEDPKGEDKFSDYIRGEVAAHGADGSGLVIKTKVTKEEDEHEPQQSEMIVDLAGRKEAKFGTKTLKVYNEDGDVETELKFFAEKDLDLPGLLAEDGIEITKTEDGNVLKIKNTGVLQVQQGSNITIDNLGDGKFKINATVPDPPAPPTVNDGTFTVQYNSVTVGTFTANQASNSSATIPLVDKKANTEGIDVTQPNGDNKVKIENTGLTGVHLQQSGAARYLQVTGGTDVQHGGVDVKTKDITITTGVPQSIEEVEATTPIENAIGVSIEQKGSAQNMDLEEIITLTLDADKANCTLGIDGVEATKFFGTEDVDVGTKTISAGEGISVSVSTDGKIITISATGETKMSGYTGRRVVVVESDYSHPYLRQHKERWEFENGLLKADGVHDLGWSTITRAVEETV